MKKEPLCPYCGEKQGKSVNVDTKIEQKPHDDDFSICQYCGEISVFTDNTHSLRKINDSDRLWIKKNMNFFRNIINESAKIKTHIAMERLKVFNKSYTRNIN